jgi:hypothetical protein
MAKKEPKDLAIALRAGEAGAALVHRFMGYLNNADDVEVYAGFVTAARIIERCYPGWTNDQVGKFMVEYLQTILAEEEAKKKARAARAAAYPTLKARMAAGPPWQTDPAGPPPPEPEPEE